MSQECNDYSDCSYNEPFALQVLGDSMEPEFPDKCIIVIAPSEVCENQSYILAEVNGERWFRQYVVDAEGKKKLIALNDSYPDIPLDDTDFKVMGIIIQRNIRRKVKHYHPQAGS